MNCCNFCGTEYGVERMKIKGTNKFYACSKCQGILKNAIEKSGDSYKREIEKLEDDLSVSRELIDLLYVAPYLTKKKNKKIETNSKIKAKIYEPHLAKYYRPYRPRRMWVSIMAQLGVLFFFFFIYKSSYGVFVGQEKTKLFIFAIISTMIVGTICLRTGVEEYQCKKMSKIVRKLADWETSMNRKIMSISNKGEKGHWAVFILLQLPLYILLNPLFIISIAFFAYLIALSYILHCVFLYVLAYYIDYKRG